MKHKFSCCNVLGFGQAVLLQLLERETRREKVLVLVYRGGPPPPLSLGAGGHTQGEDPRPEEEAGPRLPGSLRQGADIHNVCI